MFTFFVHNRIFSVATLSVATMVFCTGLAVAETMSSTNFRVQNDALSVGGARSTSTNFILEDALGELATGEGLTSTNFRVCSGFECFERTPYLAFAIKEGISSPGTAGAGVSLGTISPAAVATSDGTSLNSIFLTSETNARSGIIVSVRSTNAALQRISNPAHTVPSSTATLVAGTAGYGVCVFSVTQGSGSPASLSASAPYNGSCNKSSLHAVGIVDSTNRTIVSASGALQTGSSEVLVKAAVSTSTNNGTDYSDTLTFVASATF